MTNRRLISSGLTHAAALLVGWGGWTAIRQFERERTETAKAKSDASEAKNSHARTLEKRFAGFAAQAAAEAAAAENHDWPRMDDRLRDEFSRAIAARILSGDYETTLAAEMAGMEEGETPSMKMGALLYAWALEDPLALLDWRGYEDGARGKVLWFYEEEIFRKLIAERGLASLAPILKHSPGGDFTARTVARILAKSADVGALGNLKQLSGDGWRRVRPNEIGELWPWAERTKLVNFAVPEGEVEMIAGLAGSDAGKTAGAGAWLLQLLRDESLDPGFREKLAKDEVLKEIARGDRRLPLNERVALMEGGNPELGNEGQHQELFVWRDVCGILNDQRDWAYEFRHGVVEAPEVLAEISKELPEIAAKCPDLLRDQVFKILIEEDPARAVRLLDPLPPDERMRTLVESAKGAFYQVDPNLLLAALRLVPADDPRLREERQQVWTKTSPYNYEDHDAAYVEWVRALPDGVDREMALLALARAADKTESGLAAKLLTEMKSHSE